MARTQFIHDQVYSSRSGTSKYKFIGWYESSAVFVCFERHEMTLSSPVPALRNHEGKFNPDREDPSDIVPNKIWKNVYFDDVNKRQYYFGNVNFKTKDRALLHADTEDGLYCGTVEIEEHVT